MPTGPSASHPEDAPASSRLPTLLTPLIGREQEVADVRALLQRDRARLVTLTGPGGIGKTLLAVAIARSLEDDHSPGSGQTFADGCRLVRLAPLTDPHQVLPAIAQALGLRESGDRPLIDTVKEHLKSREVLLLIDNFEHLADAAPVVADLLRSAPAVAALVTSRAPLRVQGEHQFPVGPLAVPDLHATQDDEMLTASAAVALFIKRARAVSPNLPLALESVRAIAEICARLDGLPLAIELAAVRSKVLPPPVLLARLERRLPLLTGGQRDVPQRQQTMREAIAWSCALLSEPDQTVFRRLAVFAGGATIDAAHAVCGLDDVLPALETLLDHSLVRQVIGPAGEPRLHLLETIREFGLEQLEAVGETLQIRRRFAEWCLAFAEEAATRYYTADAADSLARIETEYANLQASLAWALEQRDAPTALRLANALGRFWHVHGRFSEGRDWIDRALALDAGEAIPLDVRAGVLAGSCRLPPRHGDYAPTIPRAEEALRLYRELGDQPGVARMLFQLGTLAEWQGDDEGAVARLEEALALFRKLEDATWVGLALENLADAAYRRGDYARAAALADEALTASRAGGDAIVATQALAGVAQVACATGDYRRAAAALQESLALAVEVGHQVGVADSLAGSASLAVATGKGEAAARLLGATDALCEAIGMRRVYHLAQHTRTREAVRAATKAPAFAAAWEAGRALTAADAVGEALAVADRVTAAAATAGSEASPPVALTPRELDILRLVADGRSDKEIGEALFLSHRTVMTYVSRILAKLGVKSRAAAAFYALRHDLT